MQTPGAHAVPRLATCPSPINCGPIRNALQLSQDEFPGCAAALSVLPDNFFVHLMRSLRRDRPWHFQAPLWRLLQRPTARHSIAGVAFARGPATYRPAHTRD